MCFMPVTDPKTVKNRIQPDLTSSAQDREQQTERLPALGHAWSTPADCTGRPEGNEFCVILPKEALTR
jgi:hypothetical protein